MANNRGKQFESIVREAFENTPGTSVDRIPDQTMHYKGAQNVCDFIVYKRPHEYYIECKSVHGNTLPFSNITPRQWQGLREKSKIPGVIAGVICWWVDRDVTRFIPIQLLCILKERDNLSIRYDTESDCYYSPITIVGKKKRVYFEYDMEKFFKEVDEVYVKV